MQLSWRLRLARAMALLLCLSCIAPVRDLHASSDSRDFYYSGNPRSGDLGGFLYGGSGGGGDLISAKVDGGLNPNLGCGAVGMFQYMKAAFNVADIAEELKAALQTFLAKLVLTYLMSIPPIAAAYDFLQMALDLRFSLFQQSCNIAELHDKGKQAWLDHCNKDFEPNSQEQRDCFKDAEPLKPLRQAFQKGLDEASISLFGNPVHALGPALCDSASPYSASGAACMAMSFMPRICLGGSGSALGASAGGQKCIGPREQKPPITMAAVSGATFAYTKLVQRKCQQVWDEIVTKSGSITESSIRAIATKALAREERDRSGGATAYVPSINDRSLAMTDMSFLTLKYGAPLDGKKAVEKYLTEQDMGMCVTQPKLQDPLRMCKFIAYAATEDLRVNIAEPTISAAEMINGADFFDLPPAGSPEAEQIGLDNQVAAQMLEKTFGCLINTTVHVTNPQFQAALVIDGDFTDAYGVAGREASCITVKRIAEYVLKQIYRARPELEARKNLEPWKTTVTQNVNDADGVVKQMREIPIESVKEPIRGTLEYLEKYLTRQLRTNDEHCQDQSRFREEVRRIMKGSRPSTE